ncbi:MAG: hypothetical protein M3Q75_14275 [Gemmatimonadota bacterium]|nr:hypothetical protein [Gemmatimonadota bacterium]
MPDRPAAEDLGGTCDWGNCDRQTTASRWDFDGSRWLPVCDVHEDRGAGFELAVWAGLSEAERAACFQPNDYGAALERLARAEQALDAVERLLNGCEMAHVRSHGGKASRYAPFVDLHAVRAALRASQGRPVMSHECDACGVAACDLPDGVDPELIFERESGVTRCRGCILIRLPDVHECGWDYEPACDGCRTAYGDAGLTQGGQ